MQNTKTILICDTEPIAIKGLSSLLESCEELQVAGSTTTLANAVAMVQSVRPSVVLIDKAFGIRLIMEWIAALRQSETQIALIIWGLNMNDTEALRFIKAGAHGIIRKTADLESLTTCIQTVASGRTWVEESVLRNNLATLHGHYCKLTGRELQVLEMVEQGMRNKDIAGALGIEPGTVKVHLKHIFEKTGIRGRYGLVISALKDRPVSTLSTM